MRSDGVVAYYKVQHVGQHGWCGTALDHVLFGHLSWDDKQGEKGDRYRELLEPQSASSDLWQRYGVFGFTDHSDAWRAQHACRVENPEMEFRIVHITASQSTVVLPDN